MKLHLVLSVWLRRPAEFGPPIESTAAMDWFVLATLACFFFLLGCFATSAWLLWRRGQKPQAHVQLLMELEEEHKESTATPAADKEEKNPGKPEIKNTPTDPWERPADWWKK